MPTMDFKTGQCCSATVLNVVARKERREDILIARLQCCLSELNKLVSNLILLNFHSQEN